MRKKFFRGRALKHWSKATEVVEDPHPRRYPASGWMGLWAPDGAVGVTAHCTGVGPDGL